MKRIECSEFRDEEGVISLESRIRGTFKHGTKWYGELEAQNEAYERLSSIYRSPAQRLQFRCCSSARKVCVSFYRAHSSAFIERRARLG